MSSTAPSFASDLEKKREPLSTVLSAPHLRDIKEEDYDEGAAIAGLERTPYTAEEEQAVKRKIDRRVIPLLAAVYFSQFFDKNSLTYSSVMVLPIKGENYNLVSMAFYLGFMIFEIPMSSLSQKFPLSKFLGANILLWATFLILHAASANFGLFFAFRFLLGIFESCVSPILIAYISAFYPRQQQAKRISCFYCMNGITNMVGGSMAYGVTFYTGNKIAHWRIFYILMGGLAYIVGAAVLLWLPDSVATSKFLSEREKIVALERVRDNQTGTRNKQIKRYQVIEAVTDPKTWLLLLLTALSSIPNGGLASFSSLLIKGFGYTSRETLLLQIGRGAIAALTTITVCQISDRLRTRMLPILIAVIPTVIGAGLMVGFGGGGDSAANKAGSLAGIFMAETYGSALALLYSWTATNTSGATKKTVVNALFLTTFALSNVVGTQIFRSEDAPGYLPGKIAVLALFSAMVPTIFCMHFYTAYLNRRKASKLAEMAREHNWSPDDIQRESDKVSFADLTDKENHFMTYMS